MSADEATAFVEPRPARRQQGLLSHLTNESDSEAHTCEAMEADGQPGLFREIAPGDLAAAAPQRPPGPGRTTFSRMPIVRAALRKLDERREDIGWGLEEFTRWHLVRVRLLQIRVHRIYEPHRQSFYHNHPRHFVSIMLIGRYFEAKPGRRPQWRIPGSVRVRLRHSFHTVWHPHGRPSWSLVIFFGEERQWTKLPDAEAPGTARDPA